MRSSDEAGFALRDATVAIVGLGLMSGSLALTLRAKNACAKIIAIDPDETTRMQSLARGAVDEASDAERHDRIVATTSHLPYLVACALMATADDSSHDEEWLFRFAAGRFRDTSRLAASDPTMMIDLLLTNRTNVIERLNQY